MKIKSSWLKRRAWERRIPFHPVSDIMDAGAGQQEAEPRR